MKKNITAASSRKEIFKGKKLTIGMDLGDRFTYYCVLDEEGEVLVEQKLPTTQPGMKQVFGRIPCSRVALETGAHSPWVSRHLGPFGQDSDLRRWGLKLSERGGSNARKRAVVAVARKLSVLLHKVWSAVRFTSPCATTTPSQARSRRAGLESSSGTAECR